MRGNWGRTVPLPFQVREAISNGWRDVRWGKKKEILASGSGTYSQRRRGLTAGFSGEEGPTVGFGREERPTTGFGGSGSDQASEGS
jgi:hypothetical protein